MVAYLAPLISILKQLLPLALGGFILLAHSGAFGAEQQLCLKCHPVHYEKRGSCTGCHGGNSGSDRKNIAHYKLIRGKFSYFTLGKVEMVLEGERLLKQYACRRCHISGKEGNRLAASLDTVVSVKTPEEMLSSIKHPVTGMPDFRLQDKEMTVLVNAIYAGAKKGESKKDARPLTVLFTQQQKGKDTFSLKCGSCHKVLSERKGLLGKGDYGPNLSGLLTEFYPETFKSHEKWNEKGLKQWLENPRKIRPMARMQPVVVTETEWRELKSLLSPLSL